MHEAFLQQALQLAEDNVDSGDGGPYGAVIVKDNRVIAASGNQVTSRIDPTAHAEIMAIRSACKQLNNFRLTGCVLYTSCEPCPMCLGAIYWARLDTVYYACNRFDAAAANFDDSFIYDEINLLPQHRRIPMHHINLPDAQKPFAIWNQKADKILY
ncbi:guanine deaminase GuaD [Methyloglobulus morosus KoM1]|uniref:Guanine deaminase GuaD n=1 Tax=Methyloglobulus morosus KoM1 TaxID=1116472 RepID=V5C960_9GAMM|nr:nucleoside deaminase [Methyloglobulus morosus]ESS73303.1 guanine deaminase GuaD [Methyloglobulus morosus KoM1]